MNDYISHGEILSIINGSNLIKEEAISVDMGVGVDTGMYEEVPMDAPSQSKDPIMSSMLFVVGITTLTLAISIGIGILLAKRKIKKGFELYED